MVPFRHSREETIQENPPSPEHTRLFTPCTLRGSRQTCLFSDWGLLCETDTARRMPQKKLRSRCWPIRWWSSLPAATLKSAAVLEVSLITRASWLDVTGGWQGTSLRSAPPPAKGSWRCSGEMRSMYDAPCFLIAGWCMLAVLVGATAGNSTWLFRWVAGPRGSRAAWPMCQVRRCSMGLSPARSKQQSKMMLHFIIRNGTRHIRVCEWFISQHEHSGCECHQKNGYISSNHTSICHVAWVGWQIFLLIRPST